MIKATLFGLIRFYQLVLSPMKGPSCRFIPTCSEYTREAIHCFGSWKGIWMGFCRVSRCHPFHPGGYDPVNKNPIRE